MLAIVRETGVWATQLTPRDPLSAQEQFNLVAAMDALVERNIAYNYKQHRNAETLNCSEFVYESFGKIGRLGIGREIIRDWYDAGALHDMLERYRVPRQVAEALRRLAWGLPYTPPPARVSECEQYLF